MGFRMNLFLVLGFRMSFMLVSKYIGRSLVYVVFKLVFRMSFILVFVLECVSVVFEIENYYIIKNLFKYGYIYFFGVYMIVIIVVKYL